MYWTGKGGPRFIRPIRWLVALLGDEVVPFELAGVKSGNVTYGPPALGGRKIRVTIVELRAESLQGKLCSGRRRRAPQPRSRAGIAAWVLQVKPDPALLDTLVYITEYPTPILGSFDPEFLKLPEEVLVTVMRHHQKYFSVEDAEGRLAPQFRRGDEHQRGPRGAGAAGQRARAAGALQRRAVLLGLDQQKKLADRVADLAHVTFQAQLGSYLDKTKRMVELVRRAGRLASTPVRARRAVPSAI